MKRLVFLACVVLASCATEQPQKPELSGLIEVNKTSSTRDLGDANNKVVHPAPTKPKYLQTDRYDAISKSLAPFPAAGTIDQRADELNLITLQQMRTPAECARAATEVKVSLGNFYGDPVGPLSQAQVEKLAPFFEQVRNDADYFVQKIKIERARKRPFQYINGLEPCVAREITPAYPSGHATISRLYALILSDLYPTRTRELLKRSDEIANDRVLAGMHHHTDIVAGQALGERLYKEFSKSRDFKKDLTDLERESQKVAR